jgi:hypothetical protein
LLLARISKFEDGTKYGAVRCAAARFKLFAKTSSLAADEKLAFNRLSRGFNEHASELK